MPVVVLPVAEGAEHVHTGQHVNHLFNGLIWEKDKGENMQSDCYEYEAAGLVHRAGRGGGGSAYGARQHKLLEK